MEIFICRVISYGCCPGGISQRFVAATTGKKVALDGDDVGHDDADKTKDAQV